MTLINTMIGFLIGGIVTPFTLMQIAIIFFFGLPFTKKLEKEGLLKTPNPIKKKYLSSIILQAILFGGITYLIFTIFPSLVTGYVIGIILVIIFSMGNLGKTPANMSDYMSINKKYIK